MYIGKNFKRGFFHYRNFPRFSFLVIVVSSISYSQSDSGYTFQFSSGSEYFDLFRQHAENSRTTAFSKSSFASFSSVSATDSFSISIRTMDYYAAVNHQVTKFSTAFNNSRRNLDMLYCNSWSFVNYKLSIGTELNTPSRQLNYMISVLMNPFDQMLSGGITFERSPIQYNASILFQDFLVPLQENPFFTNISYKIQSNPSRDFSAAIDYYDAKSKNDPLNDNYDVVSKYTSSGKKLEVQYSLSEISVLTTEVGTDEYRTELLFTKNALAFGDFIKGSGEYSRYIVELQSKIFALPVSFKYSFNQLSVSGIGHFESWPFTTLAASIIANRINYQMSGFIKYHSVETTEYFDFGSSFLSTTLSYHRVLPDMTIEHWEPEFLVFGMKNFTSNPFSIRDIQLIGTGIRYDISFNDVTLSAHGEQYFPILVRYRERTSSGSPSGPTTPSSSPVTDGGRKAGLMLTVKF